VADRDAGGQARVSWVPPEYDGGATVSGYTVTHSGGSSLCTASPCTVTGLTNGRDYTFVVTATNAVGEGDPSEPSNTVRPDTRPGQVTGIRMTGRGDGRLDLAWDRPVNDGSALTKYVVRLISSTGSTRTAEVAPGQARTSVTGLDNLSEQSVQVQAWNELGAGPFGPAVTMQSAGTPPPLPQPDIAASGPGPAQDSATLGISWAQGNPNGPPVTGYTVYRSADGGAWQAVATTGPSVRTARDVIPYDGRTYRYVVTVTNGADIESAQANPTSFTSVGQPSDPSVTTDTPGPDRRITVTVAVGQPRAGRFSAIRWQASDQAGNGTSGTYTCGCAPGAQVSFAIGPFDTSPSQYQRITVWTVNSGSTESNRANGQAIPYGETLTPTGLNGSRDGNDATWSWNVPENGRAIDQVQIDGPGGGTFGAVTSHRVSGTPGQTYQIRVRARSAAGWSGWSGPSSVSIPAPDPAVTNLGRSSQRYVDPNGQGSCAVSPGCNTVTFDIRDFPPNTTWDVRCESQNVGTVNSSFDLTTNGTGNGYSWGGKCLFGSGVGSVTVVLSRGGQEYRETMFWS
ncbi:MAG: fibronectin type III domain-containing protein, partial [Phycicoccus sp.]